jgi:hypothetical protein
MTGVCGRDHSTHDGQEGERERERGDREGESEREEKEGTRDWV